MKIEEKAERYDEAINTIRNLVKAGLIYEDAAIQVFPELKESEGEKIRKALIQIFNVENFENYDIKNEEVIAWLEKQGEWHKEDERNLNACLGYIPDEFLRKWLTDAIHEKYNKLADEVEPKFKVGDWITDNTSTFQIVRVENEWYYADDGDKICFDVAHQYYRLWAIQDAEEGDVLSYRDGLWIFIYKGIVTEDTFKYYALLSEKGITVNDAAFSLLASCIIPATKEECDLLFQKMKEAGYEWDDGKKELRKIEQKHTDKVEPKFKVGDRIKYLKDSGMPFLIEKIENGEYIFGNNMGHTTIESGNTWHLVDTVKVWSEEDEKIYSRIYDLIHAAAFENCEVDDTGNELREYAKMTGWLKSLRDRYI